MHVYKVSFPRTGAGEEKLKAIFWKIENIGNKNKRIFDISRRCIYEYRTLGTKLFAWVS